MPMPKTPQPNNCPVVRTVMLVLRNLEVGGAERVFIRLANYLVRRGIPTHIVCLNTGGPLAASLDKNVKLHVLGAQSIRRSARRFRSVVREIGPDVVISTLPQVNLLVILSLRFFRHEPKVMKVVVREANDPVAEYPFRLPFRRLVLRLTGWIYNRADAVLAVSDGVAKSLTRNLGVLASRINSLPNASLDDSIKQFAREDLPPATAQFIAGFEHRIICVARFTEQKDHATLLEAFARVVTSKDAALILIGHGPLESKIRQRAQDLGLTDRVLFVTQESNPYRWMSRSSLTALSSRWEGSPNVIVESLALGIPVVATDCPSGPREILGDGRWGRLVPVGAAEELAREICAALEQKHDSAALQQRAKRYHVDSVGHRIVEEIICA